MSYHYIEGYKKRLTLPTDCPVCDALPISYEGYPENNRWKHIIRYKCGCVLILNEKESDEPELNVSCPEAHKIAVRLKKQSKVK